MKPENTYIVWYISQCKVLRSCTYTRQNVAYSTTGHTTLSTTRAMTIRWCLIITEVPLDHQTTNTRCTCICTSNNNITSNCPCTSTKWSGTLSSDEYIHLILSVVRALGVVLPLVMTIHHLIVDAPVLNGVILLSDPQCTSTIDGVLLPLVTTIYHLIVSACVIDRPVLLPL